MFCIVVEYEADMFQYRTLHNGNVEEGKGSPQNYSVSSSSRIYDGNTKNGYVVEYEVPFNGSKSSGDQVSFELQIADCIGTVSSRIGKLNLFAEISPFSNRSAFGLAYLYDTYPSTGLASTEKAVIAVKTAQSITIDGEIDAAWSKATPIKVGKYSSKEVEGISYDQSISSQMRVMWDDNYF